MNNKRNVQVREYVELEKLVLEGAIQDLEERGITPSNERDYDYYLREAIESREEDMVFDFSQSELGCHLENHYGLTYNWDAIKSIDPEDHGLEYYIKKKVMDLIMTELRKYAHQGMFKRI